MYKTLPVNFVGSENQSRSGYWSSQSTVNMYVDRQSEGRTGECLMPWPGEKAFSSASGVNPRGMVKHNDEIYIVVDTDLIKVDSSGSRYSLGTIPGSSKCMFATDGTNLVIRNGDKTYLYNAGLSEITDSDLENAKTLSYLNNQFIYQGTGARFGVSDAGAPSTINALNYATAETYGDDLVQVYPFKQTLFLAGQDSLEPWYNSGVGSPPFDRITQSVVNLGVASPYSMANSESFLYMLGSDDIVYRASAYQPISITPSSIAKELRESDTSDAQGYFVKIDGQGFYIVQLPIANKTFAVSEQTLEWIRLSSGASLGGHLMRGYAYCYNKHLVLDNDSGDVYEWDFDTYESNSSVLIRQRDSQPINGLNLGIPGSRLISDKFELILETGVGNVSSPDPQVMISHSIDGGASWSKEKWIELGRSSERVKRVEYYNVKTFYDIIYRVRLSDPNFISIHSASVRLKGAGW